MPPNHGREAFAAVVVLCPIRLPVAGFTALCGIVRKMPPTTTPTTPSAATDDAAKSRRPRTLVAIAVYKLLKMMACIALASAAFHLLRPDVAARFSGWLESLAWVARHGLAMRAVEWLLGLGPHQFRLFGVSALVYAVLYAVQGLGLWFGKRWAEYLVVIETGMLLPWELFELTRHFSAFKLLVLIANLAIVVYLVRLLYRHAPKESPGA